MGHWNAKSASALTESTSGTSSFGRTAGSGSEASAWRRWGIAAACLASVAVIATIVAGCAPLRMMPWDYSLLLDGAWRILHGQIPHRDFYAPIGAVPLLVYTAGLRISGTVDAFAWGSSLLAIPLFVLAWFVARPRLSGPATFAFTALCGLLVLAPRSLGIPPSHLGYAMHYNRIGWDFATLALLLLLPRRCAVNARGQRVEDALSGSLCALLLFVKINYFLAALCIAGAFLFLNRARLQTAIGAFTAGFAAVALAVFSFLRFEVAAWLGDLRMAAASAATRGSLQGLFDRIKRIVETGWYSTDILALAVVLIWLVCRSGKSRSDLFRILLPAALLIPLGFLICSTNAQPYDVPFIPLALLLIAELFERASGPAARGTQQAVSALALLAVAWIAVPDLVSIAYATGWNATARPRMAAEDRIQSAVMRDLSLPRMPPEVGESEEETWRHYFARAEDQGATPHQYLLYLNSGIALLRPHVTSTTRIVSLEAENPYPFALQLPPPHGGALYWHYGLGFNDLAHPDPDRTLREADLVIVPRDTSSENETKILELFGPLLARDFRQIDESRVFRLYARK